MLVNTGTNNLLNKDYNPYDLLEELAAEVVRLNDRQLKLERFFQELANQHANIAQHLGGQSQELTDIYIEIGRLMNEVKQSTERNS